MTHRDIYTKFMIEYDKANVTSSYPSLTPYEVATLLDKAYLALIARKIVGNNPRRSYLESDTKSISDLAPLVVHKECPLSYEGLNIVSYQLPYNEKDKFMYYVDSSLYYNSNKGPQDRLTNRLLPVTLTTHDVADRFLATQYNMPWVKNPVCYLEDKTMYVVYDPLNPPIISGSAHLVYIKEPAKFAGPSQFDISNAPIYEPDPDDYGNWEEEYEYPDDSNYNEYHDNTGYNNSNWNYSWQDDQLNHNGNQGGNNQGGNLGGNQGGGNTSTDPYMTPGTHTVTFDFSKPETLHATNIQPGSEFTVPNDYGEHLINYYKFTEGPISIWFSERGNGAALNYSPEAPVTDNYDDPSKWHYELVIRGHGEMVVNSVGNGCYIKRIYFDGSIGDIGSNLSSTTNTWDDRYDPECTEVRFMNGTQYAYLDKLVITYVVNGSQSSGGNTGDNTQTGQPFNPGSDPRYIPSDALVITIDYTSPETLNFTPALTKSGDLYDFIQISDSRYVQYAGPNDMISIIYRDEYDEPGDGVLLMYREGSGYYIDLKHWSSFIVTLNDDRYELCRILFHGNTSMLDNSNSVERTWYADSPGIRLNILHVGRNRGSMTKMEIVYRPLSNDDDYSWIYSSYGTTYNGTVRPVFRKNYSQCGGVNFRIIEGSEYVSIDQYGTITIKNTPPYSYGIKVYFECEKDTSVNYTLTIPAYEITHATGYSGNSNQDRPAFNYSYSANVYTTGVSNRMGYNDLNNIILYTDKNEYDDMVPDPNKEVSIVAYHSLAIIATGHFEKYTGQFPIANSNTIIFVPDEPFSKDDSRMMNYDSHLCCLHIPEASYGDSNFGRYLLNPSNVSQLSCIVNTESSSLVMFEISRDIDQ